MDTEAEKTWLKLGIDKNRIFHYGDEENWWGPTGETGPCGPDSEMFYINDVPNCSETCGPACNCGKYVELGNNVFMTYNKEKDGVLTELDHKNIDVGLGFERLLILANGLNHVYETDLFTSIISELERLTRNKYDKSTQKNFRIIAEHIRASVFILADPAMIEPSNSEHGYILRRLIRRTIRKIIQLDVSENILPDLAEAVISSYREAYPEVEERKEHIKKELTKEYDKFNKTLKTGLKIADNIIGELRIDEVLTGKDAFRLYDTYGFPLELTIELAKEQGKTVDVDGFNKCFIEHQEKSRKGVGSMFKGGLAENNQRSIRLHTATHLLNAALRHVLGENISQKGSHINSERLRFDFSFTRKLTEDEILSLEAYVNEVIVKGLDIEMMEMTLDEAKEKGAIGVFDEKYDHMVKVYTIGKYSMEICGGPHAKNTLELGQFKIIKEQSSSAGVRRIKATIIE